QARIDADQLLILLDHVRCAAFELPFRDGERFGGEPLSELLAYLEKHGILHRERDEWHWMSDSYPANSVSLRSVAEGNFVVVDTTGGDKRVIAEVDYSSAAMTIYEGAIYMVQSAPYQVERLDWEGRKAFVTSTRADYYTDAVDYTRLKILDTFEAHKHHRHAVAQGEVHLVKRITGYKKIRYYSHENVGYGKIELPDQEMHTSAVWWQINPEAMEQAFPARQIALDGFLGAGHAMHIVATVRMLSEPRDIGKAVGDGNARWFATVDAGGRGELRGCDEEAVDPEHLDRFTPTLFLYDNYPGGIGLSAPLCEIRDTITEEARRLLTECGCTQGCPGCIGPILASDESRGYSPKQAALQVLALLSRDES
ncbi:MAG: Zn-binding domain-containing protein, partial [Candidatus Thiodiazotropha sp.]